MGQYVSGEEEFYMCALIRPKIKNKNIKIINLNA